jgi:hypothetical protein
MRNRREEAKADVLLATKHPEMKSQLPLARFLSEAREFGRPPVARARLALWEALRLRGHWRTVLDGLLVAEYAAGLREAFPSHERLLSFLSSAWDHEPDRVRLDLKRPEPPATAYGGGRAEVALTWGDALVGRFAPTTPGDQWDWTEVVEQAAALLSTPTREAFLLGELGEAARADEPARPLEEAVHGH